MSRPLFEVQTGFNDAWGKPRSSNPDTVRALRLLLGNAARLSATPPISTPSPPARCYLPEERQAWGWATQLYALRSRRSWGRGDLDDLARLARWSKSLGAAFIQLNPLHAAAPAGPQQPSPYFPSSRRFRNPSYIAVEKVPGGRRPRPQRG